MARPPLSLQEFRENILGATEHNPRVTGRGGSKSHLLSTMARSITAFIRTRMETETGTVILPMIMDCARRVVNKSPPWLHESSRAIDCRITALCSLYDFLHNRCDDAAIRVMTDRALDASDPLWSMLSVLEREMALDLIGHCDTKLQQECRRIKDALGSS
jgi:hypothetical protein